MIDIDMSGSGSALSGINLVNDSSIAAMTRHSESSSVQSARAPFMITYEKRGSPALTGGSTRLLAVVKDARAQGLCTFAACIP